MKSLTIKISAAFALTLLLGLAGGYFISQKSKTAGSEANLSAGEKELYSCGMHPEIIQEGPGNCPICGMKLTPLRSSGTAVNLSGEKTIKYWKSSMDPDYISDQPGKDKMGMDLIPVYEEETSAEVIKIDPATVQNMGLRSVMVIEQTLTKTVRAAGKVDYDEEKLHIISPKISGWVEKLYVSKTGEEVRRGEALLEIYAPELVSTQQEYLVALKNYQQMKDSPYPEAKKGAEVLLESTKGRLLNWDISPQQIENLERGGEVKKNLALYSPANGIVTEKNVTQGMSFEAGSELFKIADLSTVWVLAQVYEYELPFITLGQRSKMESSSLPGQTLEGKVTYIYPYLDEMTRGAKLRIELANPGLKLKPGMYVNLSIASELSGKRVVVPEEAVIRSGKREIVFLDLGKGEFLPREIVTGVRGEGGMIEIKSGLKPGEKIVVSAQFMLDSESKTQEAIKKMLKLKQESSGEKEPEKSKPETSKAAEHEHGNLNFTPDKLALSAEEVYTCPMEEHSHILRVGPGICPDCGMKLIPSTTSGRVVYTCPTEEHHHILSDKQDKCPECEMTLVPLESTSSG